MAAAVESRGRVRTWARVERKTFRELFKPEHHEAIDAIVPGLRERPGCPA